MSHRHTARETVPGGPKHRMLGDPAEPITDKRVPGASLAPHERRAHQLAAAKHQQQNLEEHGA